MAGSTRIAELIEMLNLRPHPEGGFYAEHFRSSELVMPADKRGSRAALTSIYFLLPEGAVSRWHKVASDEVWHLYEGGPLEILEMNITGRDLSRRTLGPIDPSGGSPVHVVRAGMWQAARALNEYALVGCTVAPGFEFADFQLLNLDANLSEIVRGEWPEVAAFI